MMRRLIPIVMLALVGCNGDGGVVVTGSVTYDDNPLTAGSIAFESMAESGASGAGAIVPIVDGQFTVPTEKKLVAGKYKVRISPGEAASGQDSKTAPPQFPLWETTVEVKDDGTPLSFAVPAAKKS